MEKQNVFEAAWTVNIVFGLLTPGNDLQYWNIFTAIMLGIKFIQ